MQNVAMSCIFLAAKIEENCRRVRDIANVFHHMKQKRMGRYVESLWYTVCVGHSLHKTWSIYHITVFGQYAITGIVPSFLDYDNYSPAKLHPLGDHNSWVPHYTPMYLPTCPHYPSSH